MRVCPACGFIDHSHWRQNRWRTNVDFLPVNEFKEEHPKSSMDLEKGKPVAVDKDYAYRFGGKDHQVVERVLLEEYKAGGRSAFHTPRESVNHRVEPSRKLTEFEGKK